MNQDLFVVIEHLRGQVNDISFVMFAAAQELAQATGGDVVGVLLGHNNEDLASNVSADKVLYLDHPALAEFTSDVYQSVLADLIVENKPRAVLFGNTSIGSDVAGVLAARLELPIVTQCQKFTDNGEFVCQLCGGKIMAAGDIPGPSSLITMIPGGYKAETGMSDQPREVVTLKASIPENPRVRFVGYIEPETSDIDISRESILISVGRGIQNQGNIELAEELADLLGGAVCASRPVIDQGWLTNSRLVGKSGHSVKPKLYMAMGISGAPEHVEGIMNSETIIAINTDPGAPIFDVAKYGAEVDMLDLMELLIELVEEAQGG